MSLPATIHTAVGSSLIGKVGRLFNGSLADVLNELFQNARRAAATRVDIDTLNLEGHPTLIVRDDGSGIADPAKLVTLGESGWHDPVARSEDPAGMGVFSLAGHRVEVRSFSSSAGQGWRVVIAADAWDTGTPLSIEPFAIAKGTEIVIDLPEKWGNTLDSVVARCARHYPIPVFLRGHRQPQDDFLADAAYVEHWQGCRIGIFHGLGNYPLDCPRINFHGLTVPCALPIVSEADHHQPWSVKVDIIDAPALQLVLPARKEMVQNDGLNALMAAAEVAIFRAIVARGHHRLAFLNWKRARELGVDLPEAEVWLEAWLPQTADGHGIPSGDRVADEPMVLMEPHEPDIDQSAAQVLQHGTPLGYRPVQLLDGFAGYHWYDALPRVSSLAFMVDIDGVTHRYGDQDVLPPEVASGRAAAIMLDIVVANLPEAPNGQERHSFAVDALVCRNDGYGNLDEAVIFVSQQSTIDPVKLAWLIEQSCFCYNEDHDSDSWDTQHREFENAASYLANELLHGNEQAVLERIRSVIADEVTWLIPKGRKISLLAGSDAMTLCFILDEAS